RRAGDARTDLRRRTMCLALAPPAACSRPRGPFLLAMSGVWPARAQAGGVTPKVALQSWLANGLCRIPPPSSGQGKSCRFPPGFRSVSEGGFAKLVVVAALISAKVEPPGAGFRIHTVFAETPHGSRSTGVLLPGVEPTPMHNWRATPSGVYSYSYAPLSP